MTRFRRYHVRQFQVALAALIAVLALLLATRNGWAATAGFGLLGLQGFVAWRFPKHGIADERDAENDRRAREIAGAVFWVAFVLWGTSLATLHGSTSDVPTVFVAWAVPAGWCLHSLSESLTALRLDGSES